MEKIQVREMWGFKGNRAYQVSCSGNFAIPILSGYINCLFNRFRIKAVTFNYVSSQRFYLSQSIYVPSQNC